mmetsp:Transcript_5965/g.14949  ORF Transcript_5965/g.14949 Transcript_5965/m.14949 type:complete len:303 (-) Transcript_5965:137-1045(-)
MTPEPRLLAQPATCDRLDKPELGRSPYASVAERCSAITPEDCSISLFILIIVAGALFPHFINPRSQRLVLLPHGAFVLIVYQRLSQVVGQYHAPSRAPSNGRGIIHPIRRLLLLNASHATLGNGSKADAPLFPFFLGYGGHRLGSRRESGRRRHLAAAAIGRRAISPPRGFRLLGRREVFRANGRCGHRLQRRRRWICICADDGGRDRRRRTHRTPCRSHRRSRRPPIDAGHHRPQVCIAADSRHAAAGHHAPRELGLDGVQLPQSATKFVLELLELMVGGESICAQPSSLEEADYSSDLLA